MFPAEPESRRWRVKLSELLETGARGIAQSKDAVARARTLAETARELIVRFRRHRSRPMAGGSDSQAAWRTLPTPVTIRIPHPAGVTCDVCGRTIPSDEAVYEIAPFEHVVRLDQNCFVGRREKST
jgi:hypothetical protein